MDINIIRAAYPSPFKGLGQMEYPEGTYCVGGALCAYYGLEKELEMLDLFPDKYTLRDALQIINPLLSARTAEHLAVQIVMNNDAGEFEVAWSYAGCAVNAREQR